jgi:hypothetical protein
MIEEFYTEELVIYTFKNRKDKGDEYTARKIQKDRKKKFTWLLEVLKLNEVVLHYKEDGKEQQCIATMKEDYSDQLPVDRIPIAIESYRGTDTLRMYHLPVLCFPGKVQKLIHVDDVFKIIVKNDNIWDIAQRLYHAKY